ncbi:pilus assembly protein PilX [Lelliottia steviae]|uniref:pilus assembly PilX family protein n=1 Tax=Pseudoalteromonas sp. PB2-1 TaxID=2907242 RepID=UPI0018824BFF|nr:pilus assembly protein PilX [Lelliottia steviae]|tara:strand:- start:6065 stop:6547 length:483 start_codon:yes stop_codon:yes gene_type:complete
MAHLVSVKKQQGVVLIVALIMVVAVTGIAVTLMSSSSIDIKITNAAQERDAAENKLIGIVQEVIAKEALEDGKSAFLLKPAKIPAEGFKMNKVDNETSTLKNMNKGPSALLCPRKFDPTPGIVCNMVQIDSSLTYGSKSKHTLTVVTGVAQEMANVNSGS